MSKCIMLIRHAEKPGQGHEGIDRVGRPDDRSLSLAGWLRAGALVPYFASLADRIHARLVCRPEHIFAARATSMHPSTRPRDTVQPLADVLGLSVDERWSDEDSLDRFAETLRNFEVPVLVCWRHDYLPALARAILRDVGVPEAWPDERFDLIWSIRRDSDGWAFLQVPQLLLAGDRVDVIDVDQRQ
ncbi:histidine phosphatase family protein [Roseateles sp. NT4]|uniref:histidine phosphatase family protein n=1 Tax=Roseateles sp. NT4 TaxID=3453715 RepID=UPI003EED0E94